jgi:hypothetical protein
MSKSRSGGGIRSRVVKKVGVRAGSRTTNVISPSAVDMIGQQTSFKKPDLIKATPQDRAPMGNELAASCGQGPGGGRTVYRSGYQDQHGKPAQGETGIVGGADRGARAILGPPPKGKTVA